MSTGVPGHESKHYYGIAAADKDNNSRELYVYCPEILPICKGEIVATTIETNVKTSGETSEYSKPLKATNSIKCYFHEDDDMSGIPPDVRKGERVEIWNLADSDIWYWKALGSDGGLRRTERKRISINSTLDNVSPGGDAKEYIFEMSTRGKKYVKIQTAKDLGEKFVYTIMIDCDNSKLMLTDDTNNTFVIDSPNKRVTMKNTSDSVVDLFDKNINIGCNGDITMSAYQGNIYISAKQNIESTSGVDTKITSEANTNMEAKAQWTQKSEAETIMNSNATTSLTSQKAMSLTTQDALSTTSQKDTTVTSSKNINLTATENIAGSCKALNIGFEGGSMSGQSGTLTTETSSAVNTKSPNVDMKTSNMTVGS